MPSCRTMAEKIFCLLLEKLLTSRAEIVYSIFEENLVARQRAFLAECASLEPMYQSPHGKHVGVWFFLFFLFDWQPR